MNTTSSAQLRVQKRRDKVKSLAFKGKTRKEIAEELQVGYPTISTDLKILGIIPASDYNLKENS